MKVLEGLRWQQRYVTQLGCIKGCLEYLGAETSFPWLYGGTGHAFIIHVPGNLDPSGPTCWNGRIMFDLAPNLGYRVEGFSIEKEAAGESFPQKQQEAWDFVRASIDRGLPCFGWELNPHIPDYYVIQGYDDVGYYYSGWGADDRGGPAPWQQLGDTDVEVIHVYSVEACEPASDEKVVKDGLEMAIKHAGNPREWVVYPGYRSGPEGFELWAEGLETGEAIRDGHSYNAEVWRECREMAVEFLGEAKGRLPGRCDAAFDDAAREYAAVRDALTACLDLHSFKPETWDSETKLQDPASAALLREAADAERRALDHLREIAAAL